MLIGSRATHVDRAARRERAALALGAEAVVLELQEHGDGEAVVELGDVDVVGSEAGAAVQRCRPTAFAGSGDASRAAATGNSMPGCGSVRRRLGDGADQRRRLAARSRARSVLVTTTAQAPSVSRQKSNSRSGVEIIRAAR